MKCQNARVDLKKTKTNARHFLFCVTLEIFKYLLLYIISIYKMRATILYTVIHFSRCIIVWSVATPPPPSHCLEGQSPLKALYLRFC